MMRIQTQDAPALHPGAPRTGEIVVHAAALAITCVISYWLTTHALAGIYSISRHDDILGGMWAVVATIIVYRYSHAESLRAALSRMAATFLGFVLCLFYLLMFPFHVWGMAALIAIGTIVMAMAGRPDETITTGVTVAVVMVIAELSPRGAWSQPILRLVDTTLGVAVGVAAAWLSNSLSLRHN